MIDKRTLLVSRIVTGDGVVDVRLTSTSSLCACDVPTTATTVMTMMMTQTFEHVIIGRDTLMMRGYRG